MALKRYTKRKSTRRRIPYKKKTLFRKSKKFFKRRTYKKKGSYGRFRQKRTLMRALHAEPRKTIIAPLVANNVFLSANSEYSCHHHDLVGNITSGTITEGQSGANQRIGSKITNKSFSGTVTLRIPVSSTNLTNASDGEYRCILLLNKTPGSVGSQLTTSDFLDVSTGNPSTYRYKSLSTELATSKPYTILFDRIKNHKLKTMPSTAFTSGLTQQWSEIEFKFRILKPITTLYDSATMGSASYIRRNSFQLFIYSKCDNSVSAGVGTVVTISTRYNYTDF